MASIFEQKNRSVFPRWRDYKSTTKSGDLKPTYILPIRKFKETDIEAKLNEWNEHHDIGNAVDILISAFNLGLTELSKEATNYIIKNKKVIPPGLRRIINSVNGETLIETEIPPHDFNRESINKHFQDQISKYRSRLNNYPNNPISWVELARFHAIVNNIEKAERALKVAYYLAPENRYVLRSLARFYLHDFRPDQALYYLRKSQTVKYDPWLLSTHIAVNYQLNKGSHFAKTGLKLIESSKFSPFDTTELSSVLGTLELYSGTFKGARKLFNGSLVSPNDNSVAQASWASKHLTGLTLQKENFLLPSAYEARALEYFSEGKYEEALSEGIQWLLDEPFASRPARLSTHLASTYLEDYNLATEIARFALQIAPNNFDLLNNLVFTLCLNNNTQEAEKLYSKIAYDGLNSKEQIIYTATNGLMNYRKGNYQEGRILYHRALEMAGVLKDDIIYRLAMANYLREESLHNPNALLEIQPLLENLKQNSKEVQIQVELKRIERILKVKNNQ